MWLIRRWFCSKVRWVCRTRWQTAAPTSYVSSCARTSSAASSNNSNPPSNPYSPPSSNSTPPPPPPPTKRYTLSPIPYHRFSRTPSNSSSSYPKSTTSTNFLSNKSCPSYKYYTKITNILCWRDWLRIITSIWIRWHWGIVLMYCRRLLVRRWRMCI